MKYSESSLTVTKKGVGFDAFKKVFGPDDRGYGYIRLCGGEDSVSSKRPKFVFVTWCGDNVKAMQKVFRCLELKTLLYKYLYKNKMNYSSMQ